MRGRGNWLTGFICPLPDVSEINVTLPTAVNCLEVQTAFTGRSRRRASPFATRRRRCYARWSYVIVHTALPPG